VTLGFGINSLMLCFVDSWSVVAHAVMHARCRLG
jgi:hypothetical protein